MLLNVLGDFGATCKVELAKGPVLLVLSLLSNMFGVHTWTPKTFMFYVKEASSTPLESARLFQLFPVAGTGSGTLLLKRIIMPCRSILFFF